MSNKSKAKENNKLNKTLSINVLGWSYSILGTVGGSVLGFLSLGLPGLAIGLVGGLFLGFILQKAVYKINSN